jgi:hypothetical protein
MLLSPDRLPGTWASGPFPGSVRTRIVPDPGADRMIVAELTGEARHHAKWRPLNAEKEAAAVHELREIAADLLAEVAGILKGASEGELDEPLVRQAAGLCRLAGADEDVIPR